MQDLLREIFDGTYEPQTGYHPLTEDENAIWEGVQAILGCQMVDEMLYAQCRSLADDQYDSFRAGFRLGAQLILEGLRPILD